MRVGAKPGVVTEIPALMIKIVVDDDRIAAPQPVADVAVLPWGDAEVEAAQGEPAHIAATEMVHMTGAERFQKAAVFEGMVELKAAVVAAPFVTKPVVVGVHVRSVWMAWTIDESVRVRDWGAVKRRGAVPRNETAAELVAPTFVAPTCVTADTLSASAFRPGDRWRGDECRYEKQAEDPVHLGRRR